MDQATNKFQQIKKHQIISHIFYTNRIKLEDKTLEIIKYLESKKHTPEWTMGY